MSTINIFCDASIEQLGGLNYNGSAGCIATTTDGTILSSSLLFIPGATNNLSEITAILLGVSEAIKFSQEFDNINLFSDSKICIYGLREWVFTWKLFNGLLYGSSKKPIANQESFVRIIHLITASFLRINLYHQKGHVTSTEESLLNAKVVFETSNNVNISIDDINYLSYYNNMIDNMTRQALQNKSTNLGALIKIFNFDPSTMDLKLYKELINNKGGSIRL